MYLKYSIHEIEGMATFWMVLIKVKSERCGTDGTGNVFVLSSAAWRPHRRAGAPSHRWYRQVGNSLGNLQKKDSNTFDTIRIFIYITVMKSDILIHLL